MRLASDPTSVGVGRRHVPKQALFAGLKDFRENGAHSGSVFSFPDLPDEARRGERPTASNTVAMRSTLMGNSTEVVGSFAAFRLRTYE
jgi:hypothetical protein